MLRWSGCGRRRHAAHSPVLLADAWIPLGCGCGVLSAGASANKRIARLELCCVLQKQKIPGVRGFFEFSELLEGSGILLNGGEGVYLRHIQGRPTVIGGIL